MVEQRKVIKGQAISAGIVLGEARVIFPGDIDIVEQVIPASHVKNEVNRLERAVRRTVQELTDLRDSAGKRMGGPVAKIFDAQLMIAGDFEFLRQVKDDIAERRRSAAFVYNSAVKASTSQLKQSSEAYLSNMASEIEAVARRVLSHLGGNSKREIKLPPNTILVGKSFSPGEVLMYRQRKVIGFVVHEGGQNSHMALITRALMLPAILADDTYLQIRTGDELILDGTTGEIIINPAASLRAEYLRRRKRQGPATISRLRRLAVVPPETVDGRSVPVGANLTLPGPADEILGSMGFPVGLYRTEFLYLSHNTFPDEESQFANYSDIAARYAKTSAVIRTFDLGYDKLSIDERWPHEDNPALGWRGIRAMLDMNDVFRTQLRAILRASAKHNNLKIMLPMVSDVAEYDRARKILSQEKLKLRRQKIGFDENIELGIMVEVPSVALNADVFARKVDFMSIGTNDLTQYTLAADRMNTRVAHLYSALHPTVLRLIRMTVEAGARQGKPVSICGEVAGDPLALPLFVGMNAGLLSMNPARIFDLCRTVAKIDSGVARHLFAAVMTLPTLQQVVSLLQDYRDELENTKTRLRKRKYAVVDSQRH